MNGMNSVSIRDLKKGATNHVEVGINELKAPKQQENTNKEFIDKTFDVVDQAMSRIAKESVQYAEKVEEEELQEKIEQEIETGIDEEEEILFVHSEDTKEVEKKVSIFEIDDKDLDFEDDEDEDIDPKVENDKQMDQIKNKLKEKIKPIANVIDLSTFTISNKPVSISSALKATTSKHVSDWVLPAEGRSISIEEFKGLDLEKLNPANSSRNRINTYKDIYQLIFKHIVDAKKPATMEQWVKKLNFFDLDHLHFAIYKASFQGANFIPYSCPHCKNAFVSDNVDIEEMIKYKDEDTKARMIQLLNSDTTTESEGYNVELVQVSDRYAVGLREPSVYNVIFENAILDEEFTEKYSDLLSILSFVDSVYFIDIENNELKPIQPKEYPNNIVKNIKSKISTYSKIFTSLNSDQFYQFNSYIQVLQDKHDEITYRIPGTKCPKCEKEIAEAEMSAQNILFTRAQLVGIANS